MGNTLLLVDHLEDLPAPIPDTQAMTVRDYVAKAPEGSRAQTKVINLSSDHSYLGYGYYASLMGEARRHKIIPTADTLLALAQRGRYHAAVQELEELLDRLLKTPGPDDRHSLVIDVYFGRTPEAEFRRFGRRAFTLFRCPVLRFRARFRDSWEIRSFTARQVTDLTKTEGDFFTEALTGYLKLGWQSDTARRQPRYSIAILHDPKEEFPPSNKAALAKFQRIGKSMDLAIELIEKDDFDELAEYDALFIRETTAIDHHTYRFARKARDEGLPVIDDPSAILRCANKVYLAELLTANKVAHPRTVILDRRLLKELGPALEFPLVVKVPDGSFSRGVYKVEDLASLQRRARDMFKESDVLLAQEFVYTPFDWRIGILNRQPLFACKYEMARGHWQIYQHGTTAKGKTQTAEGGHLTMAIEDAPRDIVQVALQAANLIGDGLFGVDLKEGPNGPLVVEVNDNPNIDAGVEDQYLGDELYRRILGSLVQRLESRQTGLVSGPEKPQKQAVSGG